MPNDYVDNEYAPSFFETHQKLLSICKENQCLNINDNKKIKYVFEKFLEIQENNHIKLTLNPDPKNVQLYIENLQTGLTFNLQCTNVYNSNQRRFLSKCDGFEQENKVYVLEELGASAYGTESWKESLFLPKYQGENIFAGVNPQLIREILKRLQPETTTISQFFKKNFNGFLDNTLVNFPFQGTSSNTSLNSTSHLSENPLNVTLLAAGMIGIGCCIYKIHSIIAKSWKKDSQMKKPLTNLSNENMLRSMPIGSQFVLNVSKHS